VIAVVAVVVAVGAWLVVGGRDVPDEVNAASPPPVSQHPTPTVSAVDRPFDSSFATVLPTEALQYVLASSQWSDEWVAAGALEAYEEQFGDGGAGALGFRAGQWSTAEAADDALAAFTAGTTRPRDATMPASGPVTAGTRDVGRYVLTDAGEGSAMLTWSNETAVFQLVGPIDQVEAVYREFPM